MGSYRGHALHEDPESSREAEWEGLEFVDWLSKGESEEFAIIWMYGDVEVGITQVYEGKPVAFLKEG